MTPSKPSEKPDPRRVGETGADEACESLELKGSAADLWRVRSYVTRPAQRVPVVNDVDVVVAGGGIAGIIAALAAARSGAKTLLVESFPCLGGNMGPGMFAGGALHLALHNPEAFPHGLGGIPAEFNKRVVGGEDRLVGSDYFLDSQAVSCVAARMMDEAGVELLLTSLVSGVVKEGNAVRGVFVENKSGTLAVRCRVVIDCTGTADVAERAGAPIIRMPLNPSAGTFFAIADADWQAYQGAIEARGPLSEDDARWLERHAPAAAGLMPWAREAWEAGEFRIVERVDEFATLEVTVKPPSRMTPFVRCRTRVNGNYDPGDGLAMSRIEHRMRLYIHEFVAFLRRRVPGFERAYLLVVSPFTHARGGKSIESVYVVTEEDVARSARFDDVVLGCDIPYRMLLPKGVEGLLAAGKSAVRRGPQMRQRHTVQLMGQAAGVAAALAVRHGVEPREVDVKELQRALHGLGCWLGPDERLRELGIT